MSVQFLIFEQLAWADDMKTSIFHQALFPLSLSDLQPVKIQLNNSAHSAFSSLQTHTDCVQTWKHTHDVWIVIVARGEGVSPRTAGLYLSLFGIFLCLCFEFLSVHFCTKVLIVGLVKLHFFLACTHYKCLKWFTLIIKT